MPRKKIYRWQVGPMASNVTEDWMCIDCGIDTAPGCSNRAEVLAAMKKKKGGDNVVVGQMYAGSKSELYTLRNPVWAKVGIKPWGGVLCVGCIEKRLGRRLKPKDFEPGHPFNDLPGTPRLLARRT